MTTPETNKTESVNSNANVNANVNSSVNHGTASGAEPKVSVNIEDFNVDADDFEERIYAAIKPLTDKFYPALKEAALRGSDAFLEYYATHYWDFLPNSRMTEESFYKALAFRSMLNTLRDGSMLNGLRGAEFFTLPSMTSYLLKLFIQKAEEWFSRVFCNPAFEEEVHAKPEHRVVWYSSAFFGNVEPVSWLFEENRVFK